MRDLELVEDALRKIVGDAGWEWPSKAVIEVPKDISHGDIATNLAMVLAKQAKKAPRVIAENIAAEISSRLSGSVAVDIAGPGFINFTFSPSLTNFPSSNRPLNFALFPHLHIVYNSSITSATSNNLKLPGKAIVLKSLLSP